MDFTYHVPGGYDSQPGGEPAAEKSAPPVSREKAGYGNGERGPRKDSPTPRSWTSYAKTSLPKNGR